MVCRLISPWFFYPTSLLPGSFHSNTIHKTSIHLESNQVTSFQLQATTMACLSMAIFYGGDTAGSSSSPVSSTCMFLVGGWRGEDSASPVTSPLAPAENRNKDPSKIEERSDVGSDEEKKGGRWFWSEEDNLRLVSAWLNNSNDPVDGNSKWVPYFWKDIIDEYNLYAPKGKKRTTTLGLMLYGCYCNTIIQLFLPSVGVGSVLLFVDFAFELITSA